MTDEPTNVAPIRPDVMVEQPRSQALLDFVAQALAVFEREQEEPTAIAFFIYGKTGITKTGWDNGDDIGDRSLQALAGAELLSVATRPEEDLNRR